MATASSAAAAAAAAASVITDGTATSAASSTSVAESEPNIDELASWRAEKYLVSLLARTPFDADVAERVLLKACDNKRFTSQQLNSLTAYFRSTQPITAEGWEWLVQRFVRDNVATSATDLASDYDWVLRLVRKADCDHVLAWALRTRRDPAAAVPQHWLHTLVCAGAHRSVAVLLNAKVSNPQSLDQWTFRDCARRGDWKILRMLLDHGGASP